MAGETKTEKDLLPLLEAAIAEAAADLNIRRYFGIAAGVEVDQAARARYAKEKSRIVLNVMVKRLVAGVKTGMSIENFMAARVSRAIENREAGLPAGRLFPAGLYAPYRREDMQRFTDRLIPDPSNYAGDVPAGVIMDDGSGVWDYVGGWSHSSQDGSTEYGLCSVRIRDAARFSRIFDDGFVKLDYDAVASSALLVWGGVTRINRPGEIGGFDMLLTIEDGDPLASGRVSSVPLGMTTPSLWAARQENKLTSAQAYAPVKNWDELPWVEWEKCFPRRRWGVRLEAAFPSSPVRFPVPAYLDAVEWIDAPAYFARYGRWEAESRADGCIWPDGTESAARPNRATISFAPAFVKSVQESVYE